MYLTSRGLRFPGPMAPNPRTSSDSTSTYATHYFRVLGMPYLRLAALAWLLSACVASSAPRTLPVTRLAFLELQAGARGAPRRIVFAAPTLDGVPLLSLFRGRKLLGLCMDQTVHGAGSLATRDWYANTTIELPATSLPLPPEVQKQRVMAEAVQEEDAQQEAQTLMLRLRGVRVGGGGTDDDDDDDPAVHATAAGLVIARHDVKLPAGDGGSGGSRGSGGGDGGSTAYVGVAQVVSGQHVLKEMSDAALRKRKRGGGCGVHIVESGELMLPADPEDTTDRMPALHPLPALEGNGNLERVALPLGRPITTLHRHVQLTSSELREAYHFQADTLGLQRGQKLVLGLLSHDGGQPALLLSYASGTLGFQEAHWALPVECAQEICSYQRLIVDSDLDAPLLVSLRNVVVYTRHPSADRFRFTVHSQPLVLTRLEPDERQSVRVHADHSSRRQPPPLPTAEVSPAPAQPSPSAAAAPPAKGGGSKAKKLRKAADAARSGGGSGGGGESSGADDSGGGGSRSRSSSSGGSSRSSSSGGSSSSSAGTNGTTAGAPGSDAALGLAVSEAMLPLMYFYYVRLPALNALHLVVDAAQPVVLAASVDGLAGARTSRRTRSAHACVPQCAHTQMHAHTNARTQQMHARTNARASARSLVRAPMVSLVRASTRAHAHSVHSRTLVQ